jgi:hypothetical protein
MGVRALPVPREMLERKAAMLERRDATGQVIVTRGVVAGARLRKRRDNGDRSDVSGATLARNRREQSHF